MTKQLNKKGTSLVELIAVIVIMGIIAAVAVPTTIGVINRQKKKAAAESANAIINAMKNRATEEATAAEVYIFVNGAKTDIMSVQTYSSTQTTTPSANITSNTVIGGEFEALGVDNADFEGSVMVKFVVSTGAFTYTVSEFKVNGYTIDVSPTGKCTAA